jgi:hypothetical protein
MTGGFLRRDVGGGAGQARQTEDLQHRPGLAVHGRRVTGLLIKNGIAISMDGKSEWRYNILVERLWRSVKYEEVYLRAYDSVADSTAGADLTRALTGARPIKLTSAPCSFMVSRRSVAG